MTKLVSVVVVFLFFLTVVKEAHAIIFLPAIVLIPIAKIVALIIGGFSIPAAGIGTLTTKIFKTSKKRTFIAILILLLFLAFFLIAFLKLENPDRPLF